jgi:DNA-binding GntR family transcriptional regulator
MSRSNGEVQGCGHGLRRQAVVDRLLKEIVQGRLRPGQRLIVQPLAERLGVGVMPIREALMVLAGIGVVEMRPNRSAVVRALGPAEVRGIYLVRRALECEAIREACGRIGADDLRALHIELSELIAAGGGDRSSSVKEARAVDSRLHDRIAAACGNPFLRDEIERLKLLYRFLRDLAYEQEGPINNYFRKDVEAREHLAIVEALMVGDKRRAVRAMSRHIVSSLRYFSNMARHLQSGSGSDGWSSPWAAASRREGPLRSERSARAQKRRALPS